MPITGIVRFTINPGKTDEFTGLVKEALDVARGEDGVERYDFFIDGDQCLVLEQYRDSGALAGHVAGRVATELFPKILEVAKPQGISMLGDVDETVKEIAQAFQAETFPGPTFAL